MKPRLDTFEEQRRRESECLRLGAEICAAERVMERLAREQDQILREAHQVQNAIRRLSQQSLLLKKMDVLLQILELALTAGAVTRARKLSSDLLRRIGQTIGLTSIEHQIAQQAQLLNSLMERFESKGREREHFDRARGLIYGKRRALGCKPDIVFCG